MAPRERIRDFSLKQQLAPLLRDAGCWTEGESDDVPEQEASSPGQARLKEKLNAIRNEYEGNKRTFISLVGTYKAGKTTLAKALMGPGAAADIVVTSSTNVLTSFCSKQSEDGYTAFLAVDRPDEFEKSVLSSLRQYHTLPRKYKPKEESFLESVFGPDAGPAVSLAREIQRSPEKEEEAVAMIRNTKAHKLAVAAQAEAAAQAAAAAAAQAAAEAPEVAGVAEAAEAPDMAEVPEAAGQQQDATGPGSAAPGDQPDLPPSTFRLGPMSQQALKEALIPYMNTQLGGNGKRMQNSWMVCKHVDIIGPGTVKEMYDVVFKDYPGLFDLNKVRATQAAASEEEKFAFLVVDGQRPDTAKGLVQGFLRRYLLTSLLPGESELVVVYHRSQEWKGEDLEPEFSQDPSVRKNQAKLADQRGRLKKIKDELAEYSGGVKTRSTTDTELVEKLNAKLQDTTMEIKETESRQQEFLRGLMRKYLTMEVQREAAKVAEQVGLQQAPPEIKVFFPDPKAALSLETELQADKENATLKKAFKATNIPQLRSHVVERRKEREVNADLEAFINLCKLTPQQYYTVQKKHKLHSSKLETNMGKFIDDAVDGEGGVRSHLKANFEAWLKEVDTLVLDLDDRLGANVDVATTAMEELLELTCDGLHQEEEEQTLQDVLISIELRTIRKMASAKEPKQGVVLEELARPLHRVSVCWDRTFVQPLVTKLKSMETEFQRTLLSTIGAEMERYGSRHTLEGTVKGSIRSSVRGMSSRICKDLCLQSKVNVALKRVYEKAVVAPLREQLQASISAANAKLPPGKGHSRAVFVEEVVKDLSTRLEGFPSTVADSLKEGARSLRDYLQSVLLGGGGGGASGAAGPSSGSAPAATDTLVDAACTHMRDILSAMQPKTVDIMLTSLAAKELQHFASRLEDIHRRTIAVHRPQQLCSGPSAAAAGGSAAGPSTAAAGGAVNRGPASDGGDGAAGAGGGSPGGGAAGGPTTASTEKTALRRLVEAKWTDIEEAMEGVREILVLARRVVRDRAEAKEEDKPAAQPQQQPEQPPSPGRQQQAPAAAAENGAASSQGNGAGGGNAPSGPMTRSARKRSADQARQEGGESGEQCRKLLRVPTFEEWVP